MKTKEIYKEIKKDLKSVGFKLNEFVFLGGYALLKGTTLGDAICNFELNNEEEREQQAMWVLRENCLDDDCLDDIKKIIEKQAKKLNVKIAKI